MSKRTIAAAEILTKIHDGVSNDDLMQTFRLTPKGLQSVFRKLVDANLMDREKAMQRVNCSFPDNTRKYRKLDRKEIFVPLQVMELGNPGNRGVIINITTHGIGTKKLQSGIDERKKLVVLADEFFQLERFRFDARCKWTKVFDDAAEAFAGFEIASITKNDFEKLRNLIDTFNYMFRCS